MIISRSKVSERGFDRCLVYFTPDGRQDIVCSVTVDLPTSSHLEVHTTPKQVTGGTGTDGVLSVTLGTVVVSKGSGWSELEEKLNTVFLNHISEISVGLRTKKTCRFDQDCPDPPSPFTLGLSLNSVKYFSIGMYDVMMKFEGSMEV